MGRHVIGRELGTIDLIQEWSTATVFDVVLETGFWKPFVVACLAVHE